MIEPLPISEADREIEVREMNKIILATMLLIGSPVFGDSQSDLLEQYMTKIEDQQKTILAQQETIRVLEDELADLKSKQVQPRKRTLLNRLGDACAGASGRSVYHGPYGDYIGPVPQPIFTQQPMTGWEQYPISHPLQ